MKSSSTVTAFQFFIMLFLSRIITVFTVNSQTVGEGNFLDNIVSSLILMMLLFILVLPIMQLNRRYPEYSLPMIVKEVSGSAVNILSSIYTLYFVLMNTVSLSLFLTLVINTMNPTASKWSIAVVLVSIAFFGALKGIETVTRASICTAFFLLIGLLFIFIALSPHFETVYMEPLLYNGTNHLIKGFVFFFSRCSSLAEIAVMMHHVRGRKYIGFTLWNTAVSILVMFLLVFTVGCLGEYAYLQIFPVYTLATMAEIAGIQRLDALMIGISMMTLVIRLSCGFLAINECWTISGGKHINKYILSISAFITVALSLWVTTNTGRTGLLFRSGYFLLITVLVTVIIPALVLLTTQIKRRKRE